MSYNTNELKSKMQATLDSLKKEFSGLRTGRASISLLDPVQVEAYGSRMPINQVGNVNVPEARLLSIQVWDASLVTAVEKAIRDAGLGLNPSTDGQLVRIPIPQLSEERRKELVKVAGKYAEQARIATRNIRREGMDAIKEMEKKSKISEDDERRFAEEIQKITDNFVKQVDDMLAHKEQEIMQV